jgi:hypothetical protein
MVASRRVRWPSPDGEVVRLRGVDDTALVGFLLARVGEDIADARRLTGVDGDALAATDRELWFAARLLADAEAKQRVVRRHVRHHGEPCADLRDLAAVYADHPDYQPQWQVFA